MARGRMINRGIATDHKFNSLSRENQWLFMRMLPFLDDYGRLTGNIFELKCIVIPSCIDELDEKIENALNSMQKQGMIKWEKDVVIQFLGFYKNQKIGHKPANSLFSDKFAEKKPSIIAPKTAKLGLTHIKPPPTYKERPKDCQMVIDHFKSLEITNYKDNAVKFYDFYMANGWVQGKGRKPIKSWKHCISAWKFDKKKPKEEAMLKICPNSITEKGHDRREVAPNIRTVCRKCKASMVNEGELNFIIMTQGETPSERIEV